ncbi:hypothetical protein [Cryobacterium sp. Y11]|uniref:hypothetical protein n=1 Tax=Cryobacterium sp. Y11 TaxID=2045016 RepID=UPI000CE33932|nr:hypothetical protein [Cryobacterium sp. Y11]
MRLLARVSSVVGEPAPALFYSGNETVRQEQESRRMRVPQLHIKARQQVGVRCVRNTGKIPTRRAGVAQITARREIYRFDVPNPLIEAAEIATDQRDRSRHPLKG